MARHKRTKQIADVRAFVADARSINEIYSRYGLNLSVDSPQYKALRSAEDALWELVREVTGKDTLPWAASTQSTDYFMGPGG